MNRPDIDKTAWDDGPWNNEPDELAWSYGDVPCRIVRHPRYGHLNGYVGVPTGHPWYGEQDTAALEKIDIHGGITFAGQFESDTYATKTDRLWWIGFDCHHLGDYAPGWAALEKEITHTWQDIFVNGTDHGELTGGHYRDLNYVRQQTEQLARQAIDAWKKMQ